MNSSEKQNPKITPCYPHVIPWFHCPSLSGATRLGHGGGAGLGAAGRRGFGRGECAEAQGGPGEAQRPRDGMVLGTSIDFDFYRYRMI